MNLSQKMKDYLPEQAVVPDGGQELFMEVMNPITKRVWMARSSVEKADFWGMPGTKFADKFRSFQGPVELPII